jgi:hypothetical protein
MQVCRLRREIINRSVASSIIFLGIFALLVFPRRPFQNRFILSGEADGCWKRSWIRGVGSLWNSCGSTAAPNPERVDSSVQNCSRLPFLQILWYFLHNPCIQSWREQYVLTKYISWFIMESDKRVWVLPSHRKVALWDRPLNVPLFAGPPKRYHIGISFQDLALKTAIGHLFVTRVKKKRNRCYWWTKMLAFVYSEIYK